MSWWPDQVPRPCVIPHGNAALEMTAALPKMRGFHRLQARASREERETEGREIGG